ncbi:hypothetical protein F3I62_02370 [Pseudomonas sp. R-28-1W-6]|uniref:hypothetical protein n=1 Tax=Pseudomonas sp. R-28-1W-6 TaxID=2650101 RepID=UPI001365D1D8|nr:hypothetical protein [Pseudomonas sp. R-28-1W-6]MWV10928.1 hypothetical protein [Pseudomonas sp. R-28-1W-6]
MNATAPRYFMALALGLLLSEARAEYWTIDEQVKAFNAVSTQISRGELQAAEQGLAALQQQTARNDVRIEQYQRELAGAYLNQGKQQLAAHNPQAAAAALAKAEPYMAKAPGLKQDYQASLAAAAAGDTPQAAQPRKAAPQQAAQAAARPQAVERQAAAQPPAASQPAAPVAATKSAAPAAPDERREEVERRLREAEAIIAKKEAERARQQQLAEEQAAAAAQRAVREAASTAPAVVAAAPQVVSKPQSSGRARLIDPSASSSSVAMPMLDANDRDSLRTLLDAVAADVVAFDCAVRLEVREAKDYPFVAALLSARIKKLDPSFTPQFSPVLKPDQEPRLVLSPQSNS